MLPYRQHIKTRKGDSEMIIIEISPIEGRASACLIDGSEIASDADILADMKDCNKSGDCEDACQFVIDQIGVEFRIVARDEKGNYENRLATDDEKQQTCESIYFDSETDFSDIDKAELYLVWQAASEF